MQLRMSSPFNTPRNRQKCRVAQAMVEAIHAHRPAIEPTALAGIAAVISLTCPSLTPSLTAVRKEVKGATFSPVRNVLPGRDAAVLLAACPQPLRLIGSTRLTNFLAHREDKVACGPQDALLRSPCHVVSVGSAGQSGFESSVYRQTHQRCAIDVWDGTLNSAQRAMLPPYVRLVRNGTNFTPESWREYHTPGVLQRVSILKIDCEGWSAALRHW